MRQTEGFSLQWINQVPYLLPYGQKIADHRRGIKLNEIGAFIWDTLKTVSSEEELLKAVLAHYNASPDQQPEISRDLEDFLSRLLSLGMITREEETLPSETIPEAMTSDTKPSDIEMTPGESSCREETPHSRKDACHERDEANHDMMIGGLSLRLCGPAELFPPEFSPFTCADFHREQTDCTIYIHREQAGDPEEGGKLLLRNHRLQVYEQPSDYQFLFPSPDGMIRADLLKDGSCAHFYVPQKTDRALEKELFHAIRLIYLYLAQSRGLFAIHSASILYRGKAWLFSGHSGMGKSTHTNHWNSLYQTPVLNGDLNLMELSENGPVIHGLPWCGTSGLSTTETYPLGGIVLLGRSAEDRVETLSADEKALLVMQRLISPAWTEEQLCTNLSFTAALTSRIPVCRLKCTKSTAAVETMRQWIDSY